MVVPPSFLYQYLRTAEAKELAASKAVKWHMRAFLLSQNCCSENILKYSLILAMVNLHVV